VRSRLREAYDDDKLRSIYSKPHDHTQWLDHKVRVAVTIAVIKTLSGMVSRAADLSCGDGTILRSIDARERYFGDYAPGYTLCGPIEDTIEEIPIVDLFICSETLEHLDDPAAVLKQIRSRARNLVVSTPVEAWMDHKNPEHYWAWDREGVEDLLTDAGFEPLVYNALDLRPANGEYCFGIWWCR
jgi:hypothetical protein